MDSFCAFEIMGRVYWDFLRKSRGIEETHIHDYQLTTGENRIKYEPLR